MTPPFRRLWTTCMVAVWLLLPVAAGAQPAPGPAWQHLETPGVRLEYMPADAALARQLAPVLEADRKAVTERLRLFPPETVRVVLAPDAAVFQAALGGLPPASTLGVYLLGTRTIVLRSPRSLPGGDWDPRGVLRHELAHAVIDLSIPQPVPLWLHEGLAILVSDELDYLDEAHLTTVAVLGGLIPLPMLFDAFPTTHGARRLAYAQAASFVRFLLRDQGMGDLRRLLVALAAGDLPQEAFLHTYDQTLDELEQRWREELTARFSVLTLVTTTSVLGGLGIPLLLLALARRWVQRRRAYRQWEAEERLRAAVRGEVRPPPEGAETPPETPPEIAAERRRPSVLGRWRRPRAPRGTRGPLRDEWN